MFPVNLPLSKLTKNLHDIWIFGSIWPLCRSLFPSFSNKLYINTYPRQIINSLPTHTNTLFTDGQSNKPNDPAPGKSLAPARPHQDLSCQTSFVTLFWCLHLCFHGSHVSCFRSSLKLLTRRRNRVADLVQKHFKVDMW